nr:MAG: hypothetical protein DIU80_02165 [Chloroflexota bacterium]
MSGGAPAAEHAVEIDGDPPVRMSVAGGFHGDMATAAIVVNAIPSVRSAAPGLLSMHELPLVHCY